VDTTILIDARGNPYRLVPANARRLKIGGYVPCEQIKRGYVPGAKSANRQNRGYVPDRIFANRRGYELVVSFSRATRYKETYRSPYAGIQNDEPL